MVLRSSAQPHLRLHTRLDVYVRRTVSRHTLGSPSSSPKTRSTLFELVPPRWPRPALHPEAFPSLLPFSPSPDILSSLQGARTSDPLSPCRFQPLQVRRVCRVCLVPSECPVRRLDLELRRPPPSRVRPDTVWSRLTSHLLLISLWLSSVLVFLRLDPTLFPLPRTHPWPGSFFIRVPRPDPLPHPLISVSTEAHVPDETVKCVKCHGKGGRAPDVRTEWRRSKDQQTLRLPSPRVPLLIARLLGRLHYFRGRPRSPKGPLCY